MTSLGRSSGQHVMPCQRFTQGSPVIHLSLIVVSAPPNDSYSRARKTTCSEGGRSGKGGKLGGAGDCGGAGGAPAGVVVMGEVGGGSAAMRRGCGESCEWLLDDGEWLWDDGEWLWDDCECECELQLLSQLLSQLESPEGTTGRTVQATRLGR